MGVIFTVWGKIYPSDDKIEITGILCSDRFAFFGETVMWWFIFESSRNLPQNEKTKRVVINRNFL